MPILRSDNVWTIRNRLLALVEIQVGDKGLYKKLEELTSIKASHWRDFAAGKQRPTSEMIESAARLWPQYAFWLVTGISDAKNGHIAPLEGNFPYDYERSDVPADFFRKAIELSDLCIDMLNEYPDFGDDPRILLRLLLTGTHRSAHQLELPPEKIEPLLNLRREVRALHEAREVEHEIRHPSPMNTWEEVEKWLPKSMFKLKSSKALSTATVTELEQILKAEKENLERSKRVTEWLKELKSQSDGN
ncbi:hypothetical protein [Comamonas sp. NoAH]|uniref:hypothetical protein n=1 Tax=Comamonas halotolerans TaxID=3041496 RepID=UPI0024E0ED96|nr:hypothetical protein [Comamonas sp. NoAH]